MSYDPDIIIATLSGIRDLTMLRTAVRLKSWKSLIPIPPFLQEVFQDLSNLFIRSLPSWFRNTVTRRACLLFFKFISAFIKSPADKLMAFYENGNKMTIEAVFELIDFFIMLDEVK